MMLPLIAGIFQAVPDAFESVWNFFAAGKLFMWFLLGLSVLSVSVIVYKALDLRRHLVLPNGLADAMTQTDAPIGDRQSMELAGRCRRTPSALGRLGILALSGEHADKEEADKAVEARAREEIVELESGVALLEVVITIAPLLGLLGTVSGLVSVFSNLGDTADHGAIAMGIAEALNTTIAGLAIAVPTVIAHSFFMKKIEKMGVRLEVLLGGLLAKIYKGGGNALLEEPVAAIPQPEPAEPPVVGAEESPAASPEPPPQTYTAMPDPGADPYPVEPPQPQPQPDPSFPRLLAGHPSPEPEPIEYADEDPQDPPPVISEPDQLPT